MHITQNTKSNWNISSRTSWNLMFHTFFFWTRLLAIGVILILSFDKPVKHPVVQGELDDLSYFVNLNLFIYYLATSACVSENVFRHVVSIIMMYHNFSVTVLSLFINLQFVSAPLAITLSLIGGSYFTEGSIALYFTYLNISESNIGLFKKIGANPQINSAFATRITLAVFSEVNVFMATLILGRFWIPPTVSLKGLSALKILHALLTYVQQFFISVDFNQEDLLQRKIGMLFSLANIPVCIGLVIWQEIVDRGKIRSSIFFSFIYYDMTLLSVLLLYLLYRDYTLFKSGLKEHLNFKVTKLGLNT